MEAELAQQEFRDAFQAKPDATLREALATLTNQEIAQRVIDYGVTTLRDGTEADIRGCAASFMAEGMEALVCGGRPDRYELLPRLGDQADRIGMIQKILQATGVLCASLAARRAGKTNFARRRRVRRPGRHLPASANSAFETTRREEWAPSIGGSSGQIGLIVPEAASVIEVKFVRNSQHGRTVADELKVDFESYHFHPACEHLFALVFDPGRYIRDPQLLIHDLSGLRVKAGHSFTVHVTVI